jgi:hypothetical protein
MAGLPFSELGAALERLVSRSNLNALEYSDSPEDSEVDT